jgi:hypothetical protein
MIVSKQAEAYSGEPKGATPVWVPWTISDIPGLLYIMEALLNYPTTELRCWRKKEKK